MYSDSIAAPALDGQGLCVNQQEQGLTISTNINTHTDRPPEAPQQHRPSNQPAMASPNSSRPPYPMSRQSTVAHPAEERFGYSVCMCTCMRACVCLIVCLFVS